MKTTIRILALKFLSSAYLQLLAACLFVSITLPVTSWGPQAVDRASSLPGPEERTAFVQYRHLPLAAPLTLPDSPCFLSPVPKPVSIPGRITILQQTPAGYQSYHSSLLANKAPPSL